MISTFNLREGALLLPVTNEKKSEKSPKSHNKINEKSLDDCPVKQAQKKSPLTGLEPSIPSLEGIRFTNCATDASMLKFSVTNLINKLPNFSESGNKLEKYLILHSVSKKLR